MWIVVAIIVLIAIIWIVGGVIYYCDTLKEIVKYIIDKSVDESDKEKVMDEIKEAMKKGKK